MKQLFQDFIGKQQTSTCIINPEPIERMHASFGWQKKIYNTGDPAPPGATILYFLDAPDRTNLGREGHRKLGDFLPPIALPKRMAAGLSYQFQAPLLIGDQVTKITNIKNLEYKQGKTGELCFITLKHTYKVSEETRIVEHQDIVYREDMDEKDTARKAPEPEPLDPDGEMIITPDPVLLFRYSALTFNGHRIHYDLDYATKIEGYPGLVIHGPMIASIFLHLAYTKLGKSQIKKYQTHFILPAFADNQVKFIWKENTTYSYDLWAINPQGHVIAKATVVA